MSTEQTMTDGLNMWEEAAKKAKDSGENPATDNAKKESESEIPEVPKVLCPCCKHPTLSKPVELKGVLLDHYLSCLMTGTPFSHTYPIYNGRMHVTVTQLAKKNALKLDIVDKVIDKCFAGLSEDSIDSLSIRQEDMKGLLRVCACVTIIEMVATGANIIAQPSETVWGICNTLQEAKSEVFLEKLPEADILALIGDQIKLMSDPALMSSLPAAMLISLVSSHNYIHNLLMEAAFDTNFWKGIELA